MVQTEGINFIFMPGMINDAWQDLYLLLTHQNGYRKTNQYTLHPTAFPPHPLFQPALPCSKSPL